MSIFTKTLVVAGLCMAAVQAEARISPGVDKFSGSLPGVAKGEDAQQVARRLMNNPSLYFLENVGQIKDQHGNLRHDIDFKLSRDGVNLFIGAGRLHYQWSRYSDVATEETVDLYRMDVMLVGANPQAKLVKEGMQSYYEHHILPGSGKEGKLAAAWQKMVYKDVYPSIDWVVYIKGSDVEYDFVVRPGGRVSDIKLKYEGATELRQNADGSITATTPLGTVTEQAPVAMQADGKAVRSAFVLEGDVLRFHTEKYTGALTIDPVLSWASFYGGTGNDYVYGITTDPEANVYIVGQTSSLTNIATQGSHWSVRLGATTSGSSSYIAKFDSVGVRQWATYYGDGGTANTYARAVASDPWGNIYVFGQTNVPTVYGTIATPGVYQDSNALNASGNNTSDAYLVKFSGSGVRIWGTYYGGSGTEDGRSVVCDKAGNVYIAGYTNSPTGLSSPGSFQDTMGNTGNVNDGFIAKFDSSGMRVWGTYYGGSLADQLWGIALDDQGGVFVCGQTASTSGVATPGVHRDFYLAGTSQADALLVKLDSAGNRIWATYFGGVGHDAAQSVACDAAGNVYITGATQSVDSVASPVAHQVQNLGSADGFIAKFNGADGTRIWGTYYGGTATEQPYAIWCDRYGNVFTTGASSSTSNIATPGSTQDTVTKTATANPIASQDAYLAQFDTSGALLWGTYLGSPGTEIGYAVATDLYGNLYLGGGTGNAAFPATPGAHQPTYGTGSWDGFFARWTYCPEMPQPEPIDGPDTLCVRTSNKAEYSIPQVDGAVAYEWTLPQGWTGSSTSNRISVEMGTTGGTIEVRAISHCDTSEPRTLYVHIYEVDTVIITVSGYFLGTAGSYASYQWYDEYGLVAGATNATYEVTENGFYHVVVTDSNGCSATSAPFEVTNVSVQHLGERRDRVSVFPNPAFDQVHVKASSPVQVQITGADGRTLIRTGAGIIDINHLPAGIYLLSVTDLDGQLLRVEKLVKSAR